jgi:glycosyltransferase involved in cell wall biosynthesis
LAYIKQFGERARAVIAVGPHSVVLPRSESEAIFGLLLTPGKHASPRAVWLAVRGVLRGMCGRVADRALLLNTGHRGLERKDYAARLRRQGARPVFVLHDLIPITHAEYCRPGEADRHWARVRHAATIGAGVIANSEQTLRDFRVAAASLGLEVPPVIVAPLAPAISNHRAGARPLREPYFVMLGTIEPRKNHLLILNIWRHLVEQLGSAAPRLVLVGQRGWECEQVLDLLERCAALGHSVIERRHCSDEELVNYLLHARALLFPSFIEGFGLPLVEALSLGVPVIASDIPVFREVAGSVPELIDPLDGLGWRDAVVDYMHPDSPRRAEQLSRMATYEAPTWASHMAEVERFLGDLIANPR